MVRPRDPRTRVIVDLFSRKLSRPKVFSDNLSEVYCCVADDSAQSEKKREGAMLFSVAEGYLNNQDPEEAVRTATDAVEVFKKIADQKCLVDSVRLLVNAYRLKADLAQFSGDSKEAEEPLRLATDLATEELEKFRSDGNTMGAAAMVLSLGEVNYTQGGSGAREDALDRAMEARDMFAELGDTKMEAKAAFLQAEVLCTKSSILKARVAAQEAVKLFQDIEDKKMEAETWYVCAVVEVMGGAFPDSQRCAKKCLSLLKEMGDTKLQLLTMCSIAQWSLDRNEASATLSTVQEALPLSRSLEDAVLYEVLLQGLVTQAHIMSNDAKKAMDVASDLLEKCQGTGGKMELARALLNFVAANISAEDYTQALEKAEEGLEVCRDMANKLWEASFLETMIEAHSRENDLDKASQVANETVAALNAAGAVAEEATANMQVLAKVLWAKGDSDGAVEAVSEARKLAQKADEKDLEAFALVLLGSMRSVTGKHDQAVKMTKLAAEIYHGEGDVQGEARALKSLAEIHQSVDDVGEAMKALKGAEKLMEEFGDKKLLGEVKHDIASLLLATEKTAEAAKAAMDALKVVRADEDMRATIKMLFMILDVNTQILAKDANDPKQAKAYKQGCDKAVRFARESVGLANKLKDKRLEAQGHGWVAFTSYLSGNLKDMEDANKHAISLAKEVGDRPLEARSLVLTAQVHAMKMDRASAVSTLNEAMVAAEDSGDDATKAMVSELLTEMQGQQAQQQQQVAWAPVGDYQMQAASAAQEEVFKGPDAMMVRQYIQGLVQNMTGSSDEIDGDTPLMESGIDSLASVELRTELQREFRLNLPSTVMFNYPTISTMTRLLVEECTTKKISWGN